MLYSWGLDGGAWHWRIGGIRSVLICHPAVTQASCTGAEPASRAQWKLTFLGSLLAWAWWAGCVRVCCCFKLLVGLGSGRGHLFLPHPHHSLSWSHRGSSHVDPFLQKILLSLGNTPTSSNVPAQQVSGSNTLDTEKAEGKPMSSLAARQVWLRARTPPEVQDLGRLEVPVRAAESPPQPTPALGREQALSFQPPDIAPAPTCCSFI